MVNWGPRLDFILCAQDFGCISFKTRREYPSPGTKRDTFAESWFVAMRREPGSATIIFVRAYLSRRRNSRLFPSGPPGLPYQALNPGE